MILLAEFYFNGGYDAKYVASDFYYSKASDSIGVREYSGRILGRPSFAITVGNAISKGKTSVSIGDIELANPEGDITSWTGLDFRDSRCVLRLVERGAAYDASTVVATCIVDDVRMEENTIVVSLRGVETLLDRSFQEIIYDAISAAENTSLIGIPVPITIGKVLQVEPANVDVNDLVFQVSDSDVTIDAVYSGGSVANPPTESPDDYSVTDTGFQMLTNPSARITAAATVSKVATLDREMSLYLDSAWSAGIPVGSSVILGGGTITQVSEIGARFENTLSDDYPVMDLSCSASEWFVVIGDVCDLRSGGVEVDFGTGTPLIVRRQGRFVAKGYSGTSGNISIRCLGDSDVTIRFIQVYEMTAGSGSSISNAVNLAMLLSGLRIAGTGLARDALVSIPEAYTVGDFVSDSDTGQNVVQGLLDSFSGYMYPDRNGIIRIGKYQRPSGTPVITLSRINLTKKPKRATDLAPGLSTRVSGGRNHSPYSDSELAGITYPNRPPFIDEYRYVREGALAKSIDQIYSHAVSADPIETAIMDDADVQTEADRIVEIAQDKHPFWEVEFAIESAADIADIGINAIVLFDDPWFGDDNGKIAKIVKSEGEFNLNTIKAITWGSEAP